MKGVILDTKDNANRPGLWRGINKRRKNQD